MEENKYETEIVIGIPGKWKDRRELTTALAHGSLKDGSFIMAGSIMKDMKEDDTFFEIEIYEHDKNLKEAFFYAGGTRLDTAVLEEIDQHTFTVYIIAKNDGFEVVKSVIKAVSDILNAGGLAVKIETSGIAHSKESWLEMKEKTDDVSIYKHFVALANYEEYISSFGMKGFGLPDVIMVPPTLPLEEACELLNTFNLNYLITKPVIKEGESFSLAIDAPFYRMTFLEDERYETDDIFRNPYGLIKLEALSEKEERNKRNLLVRLWSKDK